MKKVLVTGSSGFIGGYIVEELLSQNYQVVGLDNLSKYSHPYYWSAFQISSIS
jgi:nucleoside-diphosphate-sugar epimerase